MKTFSPALLAHLQARRGSRVRLLLWAVPKNRATGLPEPIGLWTGSDARSFTIDGSPRPYAGAGGILQIAPIVSAVGTDIRTQRVTLSGVFPEVMEIIRQHDPRNAPVEIHRAVYDPGTLQLIDAPHRLFKGWIDKLKDTRPEEGGMATVELSLVSTARALTRTLTAKISDASQQRRAGDRALRHADVAGEVDVAWGEERATPPRDPNDPASVGGGR